MKLALKLRSISRTLSRLMGWFCVLLVLLTVQQVLARYIFNASSVGLQELEWHLFGAIFLLSAAHTLAIDEHVRVDLIYSRLPERGRLFIDIAGLLFFAVPTCLVLMYYGYNFVVRAFEFTNPHPPDFYIGGWLQKDSPLYQFLLPIEELLRKYVLIGEISSDPGGLEARWIVKALIPLGALTLFLQSVGLIIEKIYQFAGHLPVNPKKVA
jgi:TRAP-type mannitol/chloroaromatic compound transport system permease small subunit